MLLSEALKAASGCKYYSSFVRNTEFNEYKHISILQEVMSMYASKTKTAKIIARAGNILSAIIILFCFWQLAETESIKTMIYMAVFILIFYETTILLKLWWWTVSSRNTILETLQEMQLQIAEMQAVRKEEGNEKT